MLKTIGKYLIELLVVAFGVLLGLYVSNWNEKKHIQQNADRTLKHIILELEANVEKLDIAYKYHDTICINVGEYSKNLEESDYLVPYYKSEFKHFKIPGWRGTGIAGLEDIAFESAKINGVFQELDIELTQKISRAYRIKESYMKIAQAPLERFLNNNSEAKLLDIIGTIELICHDIKNQEKWSQDKINEILEEIKQGI